LLVRINRSALTEKKRSTINFRSRALKELALLSESIAW